MKSELDMLKEENLELKKVVNARKRIDVTALAIIASSCLSALYMILEWSKSC